MINTIKLRLMNITYLYVLIFTIIMLGNFCISCVEYVKEHTISECYYCSNKFIDTQDDTIKHDVKMNINSPYTIRSGRISKFIPIYRPYTRVFVLLAVYAKSRSPPAYNLIIT